MKEANKLPDNVAQLLIEHTPPERVEAAFIYIKVQISRETHPLFWIVGDDSNGPRITPQRKDLLFRSLWFAKNHSLDMDRIIAVFDLADMFQNEFNKEERFNWLDLRSWIHVQINRGVLDLLPDGSLKLSPKLAEIAMKLLQD